MQTEKSYEQLKAAVSRDEVLEAKRMAKSKGMTFQGWLGQLIKRELSTVSKTQEASNGR